LAAASLGKFPKQNPLGFDSHERLAEVHENINMEDAIGINVQVLDVVVLRRPLKKSLAGTGSPRSANLANIEISSGFSSIRYGSPAAAHHRSISFSRKNSPLTRVSRYSVLSLELFHSLAGLG
jgi:hypothetical protein